MGYLIPSLEPNFRHRGVAVSHMDILAGPGAQVLCTGAFDFGPWSLRPWAWKPGSVALAGLKYRCHGTVTLGLAVWLAVAYAALLAVASRCLTNVGFHSLWLPTITCYQVPFISWAMPIRMNI